MAEYIERDFALDVVKRTSGDYAAAFAEIAHAPASDVAPVVHGRWEMEATRKPFLQTLYKCSKCGYLVDRVSNFCPNCGAKMDGCDNDA